jgi:thiosulfate dehydrogenase (quinone) large subunit
MNHQQTRRTVSAMVDIAKNYDPNEWAANLPATQQYHPLSDGEPDAFPNEQPGSLSMPLRGRRERSERVRPPRTRPGGELTPAVRYLLAGIRIALGWTFLWAFLDKTFGLRHDTVSSRSWLNGGSPTKGFLGSAAKGPFTGLSHALAGTGAVDVLFMSALLGIGIALILGVGMRLAAAAGAVLTLMMWAAVLPPASNPFMDEHLIYAATLIVLALSTAGDTLGMGRVWASTSLVKRAGWLR